MTVTFQVGDREFGGSGNLEIDFWVCTKLLRAPSLETLPLQTAELRRITREKSRHRG